MNSLLDRCAVLYRISGCEMISCICHVQNHSVGAACGAEGGQDFGQFLQ